MLAQALERDCVGACIELLRSLDVLFFGMKVGQQLTENFPACAIVLVFGNESLATAYRKSSCVCDDPSFCHGDVGLILFPDRNSHKTLTLLKHKY